VATKAEQPQDERPTAVHEAAPAAEPSTPEVPRGTAPTPARTEEPRSTRRSGQLDRTPRVTALRTLQSTSETAPETQPGGRTIQPDTATQPGTATTNVVSLPTALPNNVGTSAAGATVKQSFAQFVRQMVGLASDVGIVGASLVNNVAAHAAAAIGPQPFWGVPYTVATAIADTGANVSKVLSGTPLDATSVGRFTVNYGVMDVLSFFTPTKVPAGANDPSITVTAEHPLPVILINGTVETQSLNWSVGAPVLANAGYKVYTFNYGNTTPYPNFPIQSTADIRQSADELSDEIDRVLAETGAPKVILIGHSQGGGILPAYYINELGGADKVSQLIGLAPSNHGTDFNGLVGLQTLPILGPLLFAAADLIGPALGQQLVTSPFQQVVYGNGDTRPGVLYTTIASTNDEVVTPYTQQALDGASVTNIVLQDLYPGFPAGHVGVAFSPQVWASVLDALASNPQASTMQDEQLTAA
jgi:triacylglycerol esterase/lipase EstA (alpha/beta hydrolase family)